MAKLKGQSKGKRHKGKATGNRQEATVKGNMTNFHTNGHEQASGPNPLHRDRFDCELLCRAAGFLDSLAIRESDAARQLYTTRLANEVFAAACWLRENGRDSSLSPEPAPGVDARTDDGRFVSGTGFGGERR